MDHTYYGRHNLEKEPEHGVHLMMLDEHINKLVNKHIKRFTEKVSQLIKDFEENALSGLEGATEKAERCHKAIVILAGEHKEIQSKIVNVFSPQSKQSKKSKKATDELIEEMEEGSEDETM